MKTSNGQKSELAREYRNKHGKEMPSLKLARIMYAENHLLFKDVEDARSALRYIEGKNGEKQKQGLGKDPSKTQFFVKEERPRNPYNLPASDGKDIPPLVITGHKKVLLLGDVHLPYHDVDALTVCFDYAKKNKPDLVVLNGDIIDCFQLSKWLKDPRERKFSEELKLLEQFIETVKKTFKCRIIYKFGNHEMRYEHFLFQKAKELVGVEEFELREVIQKRAKDVEIVGDKTIIMLNELPVLHGHEFVRGFFNPVNAARGLHLRAKVSAIQNHVHKTSEHTETDLHGIIKTTWSVGCLCHLKAPYDPYNSWNHGFCEIDLESDGESYEVHNKRIYRNKVL